MRLWEGAPLVAGLLVAASLGAVACRSRSVPPGGRPTPQARVVDVVATEWRFEPAPIVARAGRVTFRIRNDGVVDHNFTIEQRAGAEVSVIKPGETTSVSVTLQPGSYTAFCNLPGHREAGMVADVHVRP